MNILAHFFSGCIFILAILPDAASAQSIGSRSGESYRAWASIEAGVHTPEYERTGYDAGRYGRATVDISAWTNIGLIGVIDYWAAGSAFCVGGGPGIRVDLLHLKKFTLEMAPAVIIENKRLGGTLPLTFAYAIGGGTARVQASAAYRSASPVGEVRRAPISFFTFSGGIAIRLK